MVPSRYLVILNMDWTNICAIDLFVILSSSVRVNGIKCVTVYPSDFGLQQIKMEEWYNPHDIWHQCKNKKNKKRTLEEEEEENEDGEDIRNWDESDKMTKHHQMTMERMEKT